LGIEAPAVPAAWERIVAACLAKNPADRPQSAPEIVRALSHPSFSLSPPPPPPPPAVTPAETDQPVASSTGTFIRSLGDNARRGMQSVGSMDRKKLGYIVASAAFVILAGVGLYYVSTLSSKAREKLSTVQQPSPPTSPTKPETGRLVVNTVPANASVYLDGTARGKTPLIIDEITAGIHHVSVEATGYISSSLIADVKGGGTFDFGTIHLMAVAAPSPTPGTTPAPTTTAQFNSSPVASATVPARNLRSEVERFVYDHLRKSVNADISGMLADYADRVDYYENGYVDRGFIMRDRQTFAAGWPVLKINPTSYLRIDESAGGNQVTVAFNYHFDARNNKGIHSLGDTTNIWVLDTSSGGLKIVSEKQNVTNRKRTR
jgi:hypothetical protein